MVRPTPLVAALGLAAATVAGVRRLPGLLSTAHDRYEELARHGQDVLAHRSPSTALSTAAPSGVDEILLEEPLAGPTGPGPVVDELLVEEELVEAELEAADADGARGAQVDEPVTAVPAPVTPIGRTEPVVLPEDVQDEVAQLTSGAELSHADLPLPDFDHQTVPQLRGRLRSLDITQLVQLRDYEQAHGARLPVLTLLDNRIAKLLAEDPA